MGMHRHVYGHAPGDERLGLANYLHLHADTFIFVRLDMCMEVCTDMCMRGIMSSTRDDPAFVKSLRAAPLFEICVRRCARLRGRKAKGAADMQSWRQAPGAVIRGTRSRWARQEATRRCAQMKSFRALWVSPTGWEEARGRVGRGLVS